MNQTFFAPQLYIAHGTKDISFYTKAFNAEIIRTFLNDDGSIHVAELTIDGAVFHLHEDSERLNIFHPAKYNSATAIIGLFVADVDAVMQQAIEAGAQLLNPAQDYDYGYRQGELRDPFGHTWMIEKKL